MSILLLGLFGAETGFQLANIRYIELFLFIIGFIALRKFNANPIAVIFGTGIIGTSLYYVF